MFPCGLRHYRNLREYLGYVKGEPIVRLAVKCPDCGGFILAPIVVRSGGWTPTRAEEAQRQVLDHHERDCPAHARVIQKGDAE